MHLLLYTCHSVEDANSVLGIAAAQGIQACPGTRRSVAFVLIGGQTAFNWRSLCCTCTDNTGVFRDIKKRGGRKVLELDPAGRKIVEVSMPASKLLDICLEFRDPCSYVNPQALESNKTGW